MPEAELIKSDGTGRGPEVQRVAEELERGGLVAFPTETVFALAASADRPDALARLAEVKKRPAGRPFGLLIADRSDVERHVESVPAAAEALMESFWPGPMTLVLPSPGGGAVGLRLPDHVLARAIIRAASCGVAATSANLSGEEPIISAELIAAEFGDRVELIVEDGSVPSGRASTVVRIDERGWWALREGEITGRQIAALIGRRAGAAE